MKSTQPEGPQAKGASIGITSSQTHVGELALSIPSCARLTGISEDTIRRAIFAGEIPAMRPGRGRFGKVMVLRASLFAWLGQLESRGV